MSPEFLALMKKVQADGRFDDLTDDEKPFHIAMLEAIEDRRAYTVVLPRHRVMHGCTWNFPTCDCSPVYTYRPRKDLDDPGGCFTI